MTKKMPNIMMRNDTILGVCEALGEDFGFNANWLRVALILPLFFAPLAVLGVYLGLGLFVFASRMLFPVARKDKTPLALESANEISVEEESDIAKAA